MPVSKREAQQRAVELLGAVGIANPEQRVNDYPHQFSGGMRQRAMIALALSCDPDLLIADEPTTALDVTIQAQILELIGRLQQEFGSAVVLITHDMGVVADTAERMVVMYAGRIVEQGTDARAVLRPAASVHVGPAGLDPAPRSAEARAASGYRRPPAVADRPAAGLQLRPTLRTSIRALPGRDSPADPQGRWGSP